MTYVVGFNGPPHSGKDTIANALFEALSSEHTLPIARDALSMPMRMVGFEMIGEDYTDERYAELKDVEHSLFHGDTLRRFMIELSESFIKARYGRDFWARQLHERAPILQSTHALMIVSDIGFDEEVQYFERHHDFLLVQLTRNGTDWSKDSRGYVAARNQVRIANDSDVDNAVGHVYAAMLRAGWTL